MRKMKDSGIEWIGLIPEEWVIIPINYVTSSRSGGTPDRNNSDYWENGTIPWMASGEVNKFLVYDTNEKITELATKASSAKIIPENSVMVALNGQGKTKGMSAVLKISAACNQSLCAFQCNTDRLHYMFLLYCFQSMYKYLRFQAGDEVRDGLAASFVKKQRIPMPSLAVQKKIADFLDAKCADIDQIRADIEKQIEILTDYKKSIITEAVTKGLDPKAKMKDSGIVRIGQIPKPWKTSRIKYLFSVIGSGTTPQSGNQMYYDGDRCWIQSGDLYKTKYIVDTEKKITEYAEKTISALKRYSADFLIVAMYGASIGNVSISKIDACVNQACCVIKPNDKVDFNYLYYSLINGKDIMLDMSIGGTQPNISQAKLLEFPVLLPPLSEQQAIASFLDEKCSEIDATIAEKQKQLETLEEYKKSLIFEYVTGKKEVV